MPSMQDLLRLPAGAKPVLQGNTAFALGALHAGIRSADGYPGTPSTEAMEAFLEVPDQILAGWSVNEAVAVGVGVGHAIAGRDALVTMKLPGLFQAADVVASAAASTALSGALVLYIATDHAPSSTQYLVDARPFLSSIRVPVIEPRDHQDLYRSCRVASDLSREFRTPVAILASSVLCHSEGLVLLEESREPAASSSRAGEGHVLLPGDALASFRDGVERKIPGVASWAETNAPWTESDGSTDFAILATGEAALVVREALALLDARVPLLALGMTHPLPLERIRRFASKSPTLVLFEDGERFVENCLRQAGIQVVGKDEHPTVTNWSPDLVVDALARRMGIPLPGRPQPSASLSIRRPPSICPGCPFKAASLAIQSLKHRNKLDLVFGDIGCSTLLHFQGSLDLNLCMGASESMRQGFVLGDSSKASRVVSLIGDSSECHSGMDATRNALFRNIPGVKIVLDNRAIGMTGAQPSPTSRLPGSKPYDLAASLAAEGAIARTLDAYDRTAVESALEEALALAAKGVFSTLVLEGACLEVSDRSSKKGTRLDVDADACLRCGECGICPGIESAQGELPFFNDLCTRCGEGTELCLSTCPVGAIQPSLNRTAPAPLRTFPDTPSATDLRRDSEPSFPTSVRVAVCGVGGQGNLFLGKVLAQVARGTISSDSNIVKGEIHGMAQKGGSVFSTFACGDVHSPIFATGSVDILVAMERAELLRPGTLDLLKPGGTVILNDQAILPIGCPAGDYPSLEAVLRHASRFRVEVVRAREFAPRNANAAMLGILSTLEPFDSIDPETWTEALRKLSPVESIAQGNLYAFHMGRGKASLSTENVETGAATPVVPG